MRLRRDQISGFYSVLDAPSRRLALALLTASPIMQVRVKPASAAERLGVALIAREMTAKLGRLLVVNDDIDLAHRVGADGVHLGQTDLPIALARRRTDLFLGISTHNLGQLAAALAAGADYVAFGPVFATQTKSEPAPIVGIDRLTEAVRLAGRVPLVAIGGINASNVAAIAGSGAAAACVISAVNRAPDVTAAARALSAAMLATRQR